jgi:hypothetical protein
MLRKHKPARDDAERLPGVRASAYIRASIRQPPTIGLLMQLLERGIYLPHALERGQYFLAIVDHTHNIIHRLYFTDLADAPALMEEAKRLLDARDPISRAA